eukprot:363009-Chlamydomonas_euryale.AAC.5
MEATHLAPRDCLSEARSVTPSPPPFPTTFDYSLYKPSPPVRFLVIFHRERMGVAPGRGPNSCPHTCRVLETPPTLHVA